MTFSKRRRDKLALYLQVAFEAAEADGNLEYYWRHKRPAFVCASFEELADLVIEAKSKPAKLVLDGLRERLARDTDTNSGH